MPTNIFLSVGRTATSKQQAFIDQLEKDVAAEGFTVRRAQWSSVAPLKKISEEMQQCSGAIIIAHERILIEKGSELRGGKGEVAVKNVKLPTVWNQIEAAMAYTLRLPLLVICEKGSRSEGLLENNYDWAVNWIEIDKKQLSSREFRGVLTDWKKRVTDFKPHEQAIVGANASSVSDKSVGVILKELKPNQAWALLVTLISAFATVAAFAFWFGQQLGGSM